MLLYNPLCSCSYGRPKKWHCIVTRHSCLGLNFHLLINREFTKALLDHNGQYCTKGRPTYQHSFLLSGEDKYREKLFHSECFFFYLFCDQRPQRQLILHQSRNVWWVLNCKTSIHVWKYGRFKRGLYMRFAL